MPVIQPIIYLNFNDIINLLQSTISMLVKRGAGALHYLILNFVSLCFSKIKKVLSLVRRWRCYLMISVHYIFSPLRRVTVRQEKCVMRTSQNVVWKATYHIVQPYHIFISVFSNCFKWNQTASVWRMTHGLMLCLNNMLYWRKCECLDKLSVFVKVWTNGLSDDPEVVSRMVLIKFVVKKQL